MPTKLRRVFRAFLAKRRGFWRKRSFWIKLIAAAVGCFTALLVVIAVGVWRLDISKLDNPLPNPTIIYDKNGQPATQLSSSRIDFVPIGKMPLHLRNAVIATEDRRFYDHPGVDVQSIARALARDLRSGDYSEGGSTITQQLAKNLFLASDKSLSRKLKEAGYALKIDLSYDKDAILERYLNSIYFGEGQWGVQGAAKKYFSKDVSQLTLEEAALVAGLPKAPTLYSPLRSKEKALERRNVVLGLMKEQNFISAGEYEAAVNKPLALNPAKADDLKDKYASYVDAVINEATDKYGFTVDQLLKNGLNIYTELDPKVQQAAETVYANENLFPKSKPDQLIQSGAVILDQKTGGIRGLIGRRGEGAFLGFNYATQLKNQPGSTFKPIVVYAPALERGYRPDSMLYDGPLDVGGYKPRDWDRQTRGQVTLREAVTMSWNIPAVWLLQQIGIDNGIAFAQKAGIPLTAEDRMLGIALGGLRTGVSPLLMAQAYSGFANGGEMNEAHTIIKIETKDGRVLVEARPAQTRLMTAENAYGMTQLLQNAVAEGTGRQAALDRPVAGKSGTTQLPGTDQFAEANGKSAKDAWFVGYTPELTAAIWLGYEHTDKAHYLETSGGAVPAALFREMMTRALDGVPIRSFVAPPSAADPAPAAGRSNVDGGGITDRPNDTPVQPHDYNRDNGESGHRTDRGNGHGKGNGNHDG